MPIAIKYAYMRAMQFPAASKVDLYNILQRF